MHYAFFGTPEFAAIILEKLIDAGMPPALVVCNPDKPVGRKKIITAPPVKARIMNYESGIRDKIKIIQPDKLDPSLFIIPNSLFDFFVVAAYAKILPKEIIEMPRLGTIGVHPSLLPKYRGTTPIQSAILNGEKETGTTLFLLDEKVDHGPILAQREFQITNYQLPITYTNLLRELARISADLLIETLPKFVKSELKPVPQNEAGATYTKKFKSEDGFIDPVILSEAKNLGGQAAVDIDRKIRALNPEPGVYTIQNGKRVKLLEAELSDGKLKIKRVQKEGERPKSV